MIENLDPVLLARIQFAFTISFHILFPAFTIGLASWLAVPRVAMALDRRVLLCTDIPHVGQDFCRNIRHGGGLRRGYVLPIWHQLVSILG